MFRRKAMHCAALTAIMVSIAGAQQASTHTITQGTLGFVFDGNAGSVRPLWGIASAANIGDPLNLGGAVNSYAASPQQDYILALTGPNSQATLWLRSTSTTSSISGLPAGATQVVLSPEGGSALFYYASTNQFHVIGGLPSAPAPVFDGSLSALMNPLSALAVSDDGALVLAAESAVSGNAAPAVVVFGANGAVGRIALSGAASAIAFLSNSHDALLSSPSESVLIRDAAAQTGRIEISSTVNGSVGVIASTDGTNALFANGQTGTISIVPLIGGGQPATLNCNCTPTGIVRTSAKSIYRLSEYSGGPVSLIDASASQPRMLVVPPLVTPDNQ
jgi:hypothetical protein